jgi:hypothetical protein
MSGKVKQPYFIQPSDPEGIFHFAGLWDLWETADGVRKERDNHRDVPRREFQGPLQIIEVLDRLFQLPSSQVQLLQSPDSEQTMATPAYLKPEKFSLKNHPEFSELWVQNLIADDPGILGLGQLFLKDREKIVTGSGRLDLLLQDEDSTKRFEVEIQLGRTDESHIIRTIEYWDSERKRYPGYEHTPVIVAEEITGRFFNVIGLFNGAIPMVAVQMQALKIEGKVSILFTKILDLRTSKAIEEEESVDPADRSYWEKRGTKQTIEMMDLMLADFLQPLNPSFGLKYNKAYVGLQESGQPINFVIFNPQKAVLLVRPRLDEDPELQKKLEDSGLDISPYEGNRFRVRLMKDDLKKHKELLVELLQKAYQRYFDK